MILSREGGVAEVMLEQEDIQSSIQAERRAEIGKGKVEYINSDVGN